VYESVRTFHVVKKGGTVVSRWSRTVLQKVANGTPSSSATVPPAGEARSTSIASIPASRACDTPDPKTASADRALTAMVCVSAAFPDNVPSFWSPA